MSADTHPGGPELEAARNVYHQALNTILATPENSERAPILEVDIRFIGNFPTVNREASKIIPQQARRGRTTMNPAIGRFSRDYMEFYFRLRGGLHGIVVDTQNATIAYYGVFPEAGVPAASLSIVQTGPRPLEKGITPILGEATNALKEGSSKILRKKFITA